MGVAFEEANLWITPAREGSRRTGRKAKRPDCEELGAEARRKLVCSQASRALIKKPFLNLPKGGERKESDSALPLVDLENSFAYSREANLNKNSLTN